MNPLPTQELIRSQSIISLCISFLLIYFLISPFIYNNETFASYEVKRMSLLKYNLVHEKIFLQAPNFLV